MIRAIHFQLVKQQAKLIRCVSGHIYDVIVDIRPDSATFGQWRGFDLTGENMQMLLVPKYFGHGYLVLEDSVVSYKCAEMFYGEGDSGIIYSDPDIGIDWPLQLIGGKEQLIITARKGAHRQKSFWGIEDFRNKTSGELKANRLGNICA